MQNLQTDLIELLKNEDNLVVDNQLNKNKIIEAALKVEPFLISLLIKSETFKKHFFQEVENVLVFDKIKFQRFVNNKSFLPDSYTAFKNKIGLAVNDDTTDNFIKTKNDVVLVWPHKDCVLEGGQTKEDQKRNEIFWNETLAPDSVDRLLDAKAFTNFKKFDKDGEHTVTDFKGDENLILKGNNLLVLSSLLKTHRGKIKLIYIDPPYNTGSDSFQYNDNFNHATWLTFMKNRLVIAKELLKDDGVIFIQCDDNEQAYLKVLMDEIFPNGFINNIIAEMSNMSGNKIEHAIQGRKFPKIKEYILLYAKNKQSYKLTIPKISKKKWDNEYNMIFSNLEKKTFIKIKSLISSGKAFELNGILKNLKLNSLKDYLKENEIKETLAWKIENSFRIIASKPNTALRKKALEINISQNVFALENQRGDLKIIKSDFNRNTDTARIELVFAEDNNKVFYGDIWYNITTTGGVAQEGGVVMKNGKKPEELINRILQSVSIKDEFVLDFHLGSGTTAAVAHKMGFKYIGIEQIQSQVDLSLTRLNNVINGDATGVSRVLNWQGGGSFVYAELMQYNQFFIDKIQEAKSKEEILKVWEEMQEKAFISYQFDKGIFNKSLDAFKTASLEIMQQYLIEVLDKNQLYVNFSEIEDTSFNVSKEDRALNYSFYNNK